MQPGKGRADAGEHGDSGEGSARGHDDDDAGDMNARDAALPAAAAPVCSVDGVCWELPTPQGETLRAVWAAAANDVWAVGDGGVVLHYDGKAFSAEHVGTSEDLLAVHGTGPNDVWAVGKGAVVAHYDGRAWTLNDEHDLIAGASAAKNVALYGVFALAPDSMWAVGYSGIAASIVHYDGTSFVNQSLELKSDKPLRAVWGLSSDRVWAVGDAGVVRSFDGMQWNAEKSVTGANLLAVHALAAWDVWAVGAGATAIHWDGKAWAGSNKGLAGNLTSVQVDIAAKMPVMSDGGMPMPMMMPPIADAGVDAGLPPAPKGPWSVWAFGEKGQVFRWNGTLWAQLPSDTGFDFFGAARLASGVMLAAGERGQLTRFDGDARQSLSSGSRRNHLALASDGVNIWTVGDEIARRDRNGWSTFPNPTGRALYGVWGDTGELWAVGTAGSVVHFKDGKWQALEVAAVGESWLHAVGGAGTSVWIVGDGGLSFVSAAGSFLKVATPVKTNLIDVWGATDDQVWAVGDAGPVIRWDGMAWLKVPTGPMGGVVTNLRAVWGSGADDVWVVGTESTILHWNGQRFEKQSMMAGYSLNDVWGRKKDDVYAVGSDGIALHYDGTSWTKLESGTQSALESVYGDAQHVFAAGMDGVVLSLER